MRIKDTTKVPMVVVGNKCDLEAQRVVSKDQGSSLATEFNCSFKETSAKKKIYVEEVNFFLIYFTNKTRIFFYLIIQGIYRLGKTNE